MAKLMRENRLRERRADKQAKRDARKLAPAHDPDSHDPDSPGETLTEVVGEAASAEAEHAALETVAQPLSDA